MKRDRRGGGEGDAGKDRLGIKKKSERGLEGGEGAHREGENTGRNGDYGKGAEGEIGREERTKGGDGERGEKGILG